MANESELLRETLDVLRDIRKQDDMWCRGDGYDLLAVFALLRKLEAFYAG